MVLTFKPMEQARRFPLYIFFLLFAWNSIGTPGVGKSTLCQQLEEKTGLQWLEVGKLAKENNCYEEYDEVYRCPVLHEDKVGESCKYIYLFKNLINKFCKYSDS